MQWIARAEFPWISFVPIPIQGNPRKSEFFRKARKHEDLRQEWLEKGRWKEAVRRAKLGFQKGEYKYRNSFDQEFS